jgi:hypothetical protein
VMRSSSGHSPVRRTKHDDRPNSQR